MKRLAIGLVILVLFGTMAVSVQADDAGAPPDYRGTLSGAIGNTGGAGLNYRLGDKLILNGEYLAGNGIDADFLKAGVHYQLLETFGLNLGVRYDPVSAASVEYYGADFNIPFGMNLAIAGFYDANSNGADWIRYETALRVQMYEGVYLSAGVRGDAGTVPYLPEDQQEPVLFLKVNGDWVWGKFALSLQPYLYVKGTWFNDYTFKYQINDRVSFVLNYKDTFDQKSRYQAGVQWKF